MSFYAILKVLFLMPHIGFLTFSSAKSSNALPPRASTTFADVGMQVPHEVGWNIALIVIVLVLGAWWFFYFLHLRGKNQKLEALVTQRTKEIYERNEELTQQTEEILAQNESLERINRDISRQKEELSTKNEALKEAQDIINAQNQQLQIMVKGLEDQVQTRTRQLSQAYRKLLQKNQELDHFIYKSAHDLKGPIARFKGLCNLAVHDYNKDKDINEYLNKLNISVFEMEGLLRKLMFVHEVLTMEVNPQKLCVRSLMEKVVDMEINNGYPYKPEVSIQVEDGLEIRNDNFALETLFKNLVSNAIKFADPDKEKQWISLEAFEKESFFYLRIKDNGLGIPEQFSSNIFNMFFIGTERKNGHGVGLYLCKLLTEKLDGNIRWYKGANEDTVFEVVLPKFA